MTTIAEEFKTKSRLKKSLIDDCDICNDCHSDDNDVNE